MVLARLLTPYEFGVASTATVLLAFLTILTDVGFGPAVIQRTDLNQDDLDNIFSFTALLGLILGLISFGSSWIIASFYGNELLRPVVQILSVGLFLSSLNIVPAALMRKNLRFKEMATRSVAFSVFFGIVGVVSAFLGAGVYALVFPQVLSSLCTFFYNNHFYPVKLRKHLSFEPIKRIFSYSIYVFLTNFGNYLGRNLDKLIIGKSISQDALGYYDKSYRLMQLPMSYISSVFAPVLQPIFASLQDNKKEIGNKYAKVVSFIASLAFPAAVVLYYAAEDIIVVMFGEAWIPSVPVFKILALSIPITLMCSPNGAVYMACNATKEMFWLSIIGLPFFFAVYAYAAILGKSIEAFGWAWVFNELFGFCVSYYVLYYRVMHSTLWPVFKGLIWPFLGGVALIILYNIFNAFFPIGNHLVQMVLKLGIGGLFVLLFLKITGQFDVFSFIRIKVFKKKT